MIDPLQPSPPATDAKSRRLLVALLTRGNRLVGLALCALMLALVAVVAHQYSRYVASYPYIAVDDSLANVSFSLAEQGRYGFQASPLQGPLNLPRNEHFFNYGPWYFYVGAALIWCFGYSLELLRSIHLVVVVLAVLTATLWFRGPSGRPAAALFAVLTMESFHIVHWAMVRPDVMVSLFAIMLVVASGLCLLGGGAWLWALTGFAATSAATSHPISWSIVPVSGALLVVKWILDVRGSVGEARRDPPKREMVALLGGGLAGLFLFYAAFHFRFADHWAFISAYRKFAAERSGEVTYLAVLKTHLNSAYWYLPPNTQNALIFTAAAAWLVCSLALWTRSPAGRRLLAYLLPPLAVWTAYVVSLGFYTNYHSGYTILPQLMAFWSASALAYVALEFATERWPRLGSALALAAGLIVGTMAIRSLQGMQSKPGYKEQVANRWVPLSRFFDEVLNIVPRGARAWGSIFFGIESPTRLQLVQFTEGLTLAAEMRDPRPAALAPEYLVWGYPERCHDLLVSVAGGDRSYFGGPPRLFPEFRYRVVSLVSAAPYGVTRVYERVRTSDASNGARDRLSLPFVSVYDAATRSWSRFLDVVTGTRFVAVAPQVLRVGYVADPEPRSAQRTVAAELPPATYLLRVSLGQGQAQAPDARMIAVSSSADLKETFGELGPAFDTAQYAPGDDEVFLLYGHLGGRVFLSQFDASAGSSLKSVDVYRVRRPRDFEEESASADSTPLPPVDRWNASPGVVVERKKDTFYVLGDGTQYGYQIVSPHLPVVPGREISVRLEYEVESGKPCVGVLNETGKEWVVPAAEALARYRFQSGKNRSIAVVFANCNPAVDARPTRFVYRAGGYRQVSVGDRTYADSLVESARKR